ncbi:hypothetical protein NDU88_001306 [Pleurodeles waltl]|uniref:Uncharacterized protein n=1 Tax=Pleurodeles waltl TaxID=8319 RepID=A0AAV7WKH4_PLEWA|nr:hypothetical protein NDU88_001306 [Pleurodeles waltl]
MSSPPNRHLNGLLADHQSIIHSRHADNVDSPLPSSVLHNSRTEMDSARTQIVPRPEQKHLQNTPLRSLEHWIRRSSHYAFVWTDRGLASDKDVGVAAFISMMTCGQYVTYLIAFKTRGCPFPARLGRQHPVGRVAEKN